MLGYFLKLRNLLPYSCYKTFDEIPFEGFYKLNGFKVLIIDLDNTLIPYDLAVADEHVINQMYRLRDIGYKIYIASNNHKDRVAKFCKDFSFIKYMANACKPFKKCFKWVLKDSGCTKNEILCIGDQLITDVLGSTSMGIKTILVKPLKKKSEKWYTKINRHNEHIVLRRMKKKYPSIHKEIMVNHED